MDAGGLRFYQSDSDDGPGRRHLRLRSGNRLRIATVAGVSETSIYDGDGVRFSRQVGAGPVIRAVTDPTAGLPVTIDDGTRKYVWGLGLAYAVSGTGIELYHTDRLGSIRAVTDATGAVIATYRTDEFGIPTTATGSAGSPFRYTGEPLDASGLTYLRARHYDPTIGRFLSRDPFSGVAAAPLSLNRYSYVANNPATWSDPSGLWTIGVCVSFSFSVFGGVVQADGCVVASTNLQVGLTGSLGGGGSVGPVPVSGSAGLVAQVSNADYLEDLAGPFYNVGAAAGAVAGAQGSGFGGKGRCGQSVFGGTLGVQLTTPKANVYGMGSGTAVQPVLGAAPPPCAVQAVAAQVSSLAQYPLPGPPPSLSAAKSRTLR